MARIGKAYGLFDCEASKADIEGLLPMVRDCARIPSDMRHYLAEGMEGLGDVPAYISDFMKTNGFRYAFKGKLPGSSDGATADEVAHMLNQGYQSPLFARNAPFRGNVVHEEDGKPVLMG